MEPTPFTTPDLSRLLGLFARLVEQCGCTALTAATLPEFLARPGPSVLFFAEDPQRIPETWDVAVVLPDLLRGPQRCLPVGLLDPPLARSLASRYAVVLWPSLVFLRDGQQVGTIERMQSWQDYAEQIPQILARSAAPH